MPQDKPASRDDLHMAKMDRIYAMQPKLARWPVMAAALANAAIANVTNGIAQQVYTSGIRTKRLT